MTRQELDQIDLHAGSGTTVQQAASNIYRDWSDSADAAEFAVYLLSLDTILYAILTAWIAYFNVGSSLAHH